MELITKILGVTLLCSTVFQLSQTAPSTEKPNICGDYDCPKYRVDKKSSKEDYEVRVYQGNDVWIQTSFTSFLPFFRDYTLFRRLYGYITGKNEQGSEFKMTVPVVMNTEGRMKTMRFYLGTGAFPNPTDKEVKLKTTKEFKVYVRNYTSYWTFDEGWNAKKLNESLTRDKVAFNNEQYYSVGYSRPTLLKSTYKEIWFLPKGADI